MVISLSLSIFLFLTSPFTFLQKWALKCLIWIFRQKNEWVAFYFFSFFTHLNNFKVAYFIEPFVIFHYVCYFEGHLGAAGPGLEEAV